jgi:hypothetical protein
MLSFNTYIYTLCIFHNVQSMQYMIESLSPTHLFKIVGIHLGFKYYSIHVSSNQAIKIKNYTYHSLTYSNL